MNFQLLFAVVLHCCCVYLGKSQSFSVDSRTCAILDGREARCWGNIKRHGPAPIPIGQQSESVYIGDAPGEMGVNIPVVDLGTVSAPQTIYTSYYGACVLFANRKLKCWGEPIGYENTEIVRYDDTAKMGDNLPFLDLGTDVNVKQMCHSADHACALTTEGRVKCWGENKYGQLGSGDQTDRGQVSGDMGDNLPFVDLGNDLRATQISCNQADHTCAVLESGDVKCWGRNDQGQLGLGDATNRGDNAGEMGTDLPLVNLGTGVTALQVATGFKHTCAILNNHEVKCWGDNEYGQLGYENITDRGISPVGMGDNLPTVDLGAGAAIEKISLGWGISCAVMTGGAEVKCWGFGFGGALGQENSNSVGHAPGTMGPALNAIDLGTNRKVNSIEVGFAHICVSFEVDYSLKCWGFNSEGILGLGDTDDRGDEPGEMGTNLPFIDLGPGRSIFDGATLAPSPEPSAAPTQTPTDVPTPGPSNSPTGPTPEPTTSVPTATPDRTDMLIEIGVGSLAAVLGSCVLCAFWGRGRGRGRSRQINPA